MRFQDWDVRLADAIDAAKGKVFSYGHFDCCLFAADCILAQTGIDRAAALRGYTSKLEALKIIAAYGSFEAMVGELLGQAPMHISRAGRGDVVLSPPVSGEEPSIQALGICDGMHSWFPGKTGLVAFKTIECVKAWRVE